MDSTNSIATATGACRQYAALAALRLWRKGQRAAQRLGILARLRPYARWFGGAIAVILIAGSFAALFDQLKDIDATEVEASLRAYPLERLLLAAVLIVCAYATLTFYDWFALKTIGALGIPYRIAALASFSSYSIGHNIGATAFSGGAIRYRIYSSRGLCVVDVAKICFVAF